MKLNILIMSSTVIIDNIAWTFSLMLKTLNWIEWMNWNADLSHFCDQFSLIRYVVLIRIPKSDWKSIETEFSFFFICSTTWGTRWVMYAVIISQNIAITLSRWLRHVLVTEKSQYRHRLIIHTFEYHIYACKYIHACNAIVYAASSTRSPSQFNNFFESKRKRS